MTVLRPALLKYLREAGYSFKTSGRRYEVWRRRGGSERVLVPRKPKDLPPRLAESVLHGMGMSREAAEKIVQSWLDADSD